MNLLKLYKTGKIKKLYVGMLLQDFHQTKISKKVSDIIYADEMNNPCIFSTQLGIEIRFFEGKIASISIDPNYPNFTLGKIKLKPNLTLDKLITFYDKNKIKWRFMPRPFDKEVEIVTINPKILVIFSFNKNYVRISKLYLTE